MTKVITRYPPSPTGSLHIGNIRTLLFNFLYTRKHNGEIVMRFEDTDKERSSQEHEVVALETLEALGLTYDRGPFRQSERTDAYIAAIEKLIADDKAYVAEESQDEEGEHVIRFRNPNTDITFTDIIRGDITINTSDFGDFVIARSRTSPIYHLTVVVDDIEMGITHVIRGEDHVTSTPRQMLLIEALGGSVPTYAHLPLIIGSDKKKLGKRHGAVTYQEFEALGYLPEAITNYLALLGWNPGDDREFFTLEELIDAFSLSRVNNSPAMFSYEKLDSINKMHIEKLDDETYTTRIAPFCSEVLRTHDMFEPFVIHVLRERVEKFSDARDMEQNGEYDWFLHTPILETSKIAWKHSSSEEAKMHLSQIKEILASCAENEWRPEHIKDLFWPYAEEHGKGDVLWPLRYSITGKDRSPDPITVLYLIGQNEALDRITRALDTL